MSERVQVTAGGVAALGALAIVVFLGVVLWRYRKQIGNAVNPVSDQNLAYKGANAVTAAVTGGRETSFGGALAELFSPSVRAANAAIRAPVVLRNKGKETTAPAMPALGGGLRYDDATLERAGFSLSNPGDRPLDILITKDGA